MPKAFAMMHYYLKNTRRTLTFRAKALHEEISPHIFQVVVSLSIQNFLIIGTIYTGIDRPLIYGFQIKSFRVNLSIKFK